MDTQAQTGSGDEHGQAGVLDLEHLARCSRGDRMLESELLTLYAEQARQQMLILLGSQDEDARKRALHTLKGSALAVGVSRVAAAAARLEAVGFDRARQAHGAWLAILESDVAAAESRIRHYLASHDRAGVSDPA